MVLDIFRGCFTESDEIVGHEVVVPVSSPCE